MLSPLLCSLFTYNILATHNSNSIIMFAENKTALGLITDDDETTYRE